MSTAPSQTVAGERLTMNDRVYAAAKGRGALEAGDVTARTGLTISQVRSAFARLVRDGNARIVQAHVGFDVPTKWEVP